MNTFVSYAQNLEDVILNRVFRDVDSGFYVDVGAWDPERDSVTRLFYEKGWSGINIEPIEHYYKRLLLKRPLDINLNLAISDSAGLVQILDVIGSGMSSIESEATHVALKHGLKTRTREIKAVTLNEVVKSYAATKLIQFLKIDVEGHELAVIKSLDWSIYRPIVVVVEAVGSTGEHPNWMSWDEILVDANYGFVYFDGLNRFYLRNESYELRVRFATPPNVFDGFVLASSHAMSANFVTRMRQWLEKWLPKSIVLILHRVFKKLLRSLKRE